LNYGGKILVRGPIKLRGHTPYSIKS